MDMRIAFFDAKPYDKPSFDRYGEEHGIKFKYFEAKLNEDTVDLARGFDGVCAFVNDTINAAVWASPSWLCGAPATITWI